ncbi:unnamed protein product [Didymodactylos carnosus]|uniref:Uncharacterized protein n=1 Tax=Didymodactylos carnosus TaxID=1234261 RepID=A0A816EKX9_9BILA|nr:unnamed protein product [Didymodactylos carnosus]CAF4580607.1 unnamed protein product [Didymodactylos carnosus]
MLSADFLKRSVTKISHLLFAYYTLNANKTEENIHLIQELYSKTRKIDELNMMTAELEAALEYMIQKLEEVSSMRMQLDRNLEDTNGIRRKFDLSVRDIKRLQDDLLTVTRENQVYNEHSLLIL